MCESDPSCVTETNGFVSLLFYLSKKKGYLCFSQFAGQLATSLSIVILLLQFRNYKLNLINFPGLQNTLNGKLAAASHM